MASTLAKNSNIIGNVLFLLLFCYTICYSSGFPKLPTLQLIMFEVNYSRNKPLAPQWSWCMCAGRSASVLWVWSRVSVPGAEDVSRGERSHDASSGHGGSPGEVTHTLPASISRCSSSISDTLCTVWPCPLWWWSGNSGQHTTSDSRPHEMLESPSTSSSSPRSSSLKLL